eukprot:324860-Pyramimonas_sp.AAC.1
MVSCGLSREASCRPVGVSGKPLGSSWGRLGRVGAIFRRLGALLDHLKDFLGLSWPVLEPFPAPKRHATNR